MAADGQETVHLWTGCERLGSNLAANSPKQRGKGWPEVELAQVKWGGDEGTRTLNPRLAKAVRYQLRHVPAAAHDSGRREQDYRTELPGRSGASAGRWPGSPSRGRLVPEVSFLGGRGLLTEGQETPDGGGYEQQLLHSDPNSSRRRRRRGQRRLARATAIPYRWIRVAVVGLGGLEPPTSSLSGMRSNRLSYRPGSRLARVPGAA